MVDTTNAEWGTRGRARQGLAEMDRLNGLVRCNKGPTGEVIVCDVGRTARVGKQDNRNVRRRVVIMERRDGRMRSNDCVPIRVDDSWFRHGGKVMERVSQNGVGKACSRQAFEIVSRMKREVG